MNEETVKFNLSMPPKFRSDMKKEAGRFNLSTNDYILFVLEFAKQNDQFDEYMKEYMKKLLFGDKL
ncbi:hypothetical protein QZN10_39685 [Burkholderia contaminans]|jgi:hypothetical protein|uniref:hypothetical protein n=1 Tax=Burkholderia contaminans TaxID=488447 RepID=UPI00066D17A2|nr:hypothetical protein [Burkholderia contaminans]MDN8026744.1 hypothetical protein [Burkholderia contaminans]